jgi:hypothetical protein
MTFSAKPFHDLPCARVDEGSLIDKSADAPKQTRT